MIEWTSDSIQMLVGIVGLVVMSILTYSQRINETWGFTMVLFFGIVFIASLLSISPEMPDKIKDLKSDESVIPAPAKKKKK